MSPEEPTASSSVHPRGPVSCCLHRRALESLGVDPGWTQVPVASQHWEQGPQLSGALLAHGVPAADAEA